MPLEKLLGLLQSLIGLSFSLSLSFMLRAGDFSSQWSTLVGCGLLMDSGILSVRLHVGNHHNRDVWDMLPIYMHSQLTHPLLYLHVPLKIKAERSWQHKAHCTPWHCVCRPCDGVGHERPLWIEKNTKKWFSQEYSGTYIGWASVWGSELMDFLGLCK